MPRGPNPSGHEAGGSECCVNPGFLGLAPRRARSVIPWQTRFEERGGGKRFSHKR
jgi:hypothetical protein